MLKTIDRYNGYVIQKVTKANGTLVRYQTVAESSIGDASAVISHNRLMDARQHLGMPAPKATVFTAPKSSYAQNGKRQGLTVSTLR